MISPELLRTQVCLAPAPMLLKWSLGIGVGDGVGVGLGVGVGGGVEVGLGAGTGVGEGSMIAGLHVLETQSIPTTKAIIMEARMTILSIFLIGALITRFVNTSYSLLLVIEGETLWLNLQLIVG